jgi:hypothetical protein
MSPSRAHRPEYCATTTSRDLALALTASARRWPQGPRVSPLTTISPVSTASDSATAMLSRRRDRPTARSAVSSELAASWPSPISAPITAEVGNRV